MPAGAGSSGSCSETSGALDYAWERAERHAASALAALDCLPESNAKGRAPLPRPLCGPALGLTLPTRRWKALKSRTRPAGHGTAYILSEGATGRQVEPGGSGLGLGAEEVIECGVELLGGGRVDPAVGGDQEEAEGVAVVLLFL
jgi:hypothetical protein